MRPLRSREGHSDQYAWRFLSSVRLDAHEVTSQIHIDTVRGRLRWFRWRGLTLILVFVLGLTAFCGGAEVSDRDVSSADFMAKVTYPRLLYHPQ